MVWTYLRLVNVQGKFKMRIFTINHGSGEWELYGLLSMYIYKKITVFLCVHHNLIFQGEYAEITSVKTEIHAQVYVLGRFTQ